jgi:hypothetical protein
MKVTDRIRTSRALRDFRRRVAQLPEHERYMRELRYRAYNGIGPTEEMYALAVRAYESAPNEIERARITAWLRPLEHGRRVRVKSVKASLINEESA